MIDQVDVERFKALISDPVCMIDWRRKTFHHDCQVWRGNLDSHGYGRIDRTRAAAHRVSYELFVGPIPKRMHVLHVCDNPSCVNPNHLFVGTNRQNIDDMIAKGRASRGENHGPARITEAQALEIIRLHAEGLTRKEIVARMNDPRVTRNVVRSIVLNLKWKHLPRPRSAT